MVCARIICLFLFLPFFGLTGCTSENEKEVPPVQPFQLLSPSNDAEEVSLTPELTWSEAVHAEHYQITISRRADFSTVAFALESSTIKAQLTTALEAGTVYYWKVSAVNKSGSVDASNNGMSFRTSARPPLPSPGITKYYVSPDGEDNPDQGTATSPFRTLAYAASRVPPNEGDTIMVRQGTYNETKPSIIPIGVNLIGAGEDVTIIRSSGVTVNSSVDVNNPDYKIWYDGSLIQLISPNRTVFRNNQSSSIAPANGSQVLSGFTIDGVNKSLKAGVWVENRSNVIIHHVTFKDIAQRGAVIAAGDKPFYVYPDYYLKGIIVHDCKFLNCARDLSNESLGNLCIAQLEDSEIYNITINEIEGYGIKFIYDGYFKNVKIHDCNITVNETDQNWGEDISIELWNVGPGNEIANVNCNTWLSIVNHPDKFVDVTDWNMRVSNTRIIDKNGVSTKEGMEIAAPNVEIASCYIENKGFSIAVWDMGRSNINIRNNVFRNIKYMTNWTGGAGVYIDNSREWDFNNIKIFNNVFDKFNVPVRIKGDRIKLVEVSNNLIFETAQFDLQATGENIIFTNNAKSSGEFALSGATVASDNLIVDPGIKASGDRWSTYYQPSDAQSLLIDKGKNMGYPFVGAAPDIGAFELK